VLYRGIATRAFERRFQLADHVRAVEAVTENGLLHVDLVRQVPEALKPRRIEIASQAPQAAAVIASEPKPVN
jgi:molecular chaperone IbpA